MEGTIMKWHLRLGALLARLGLALPGKVAPATAAAALRQTICHILNELGV